MQEKKLEPIQDKGVRFLTNRPKQPNGKPMSAVLAFAPGRGKTPITCRAARKVNAKTILVICPAPKICKDSWRWHLVEWGDYSRDDVHIVTEGKERIPKKPIVEVSYEMLMRPGIWAQIIARKWDALIIDEVHRLKNYNAKRTKKILGGKLPLVSRATWRWLLSGTITPNSPAELWTLIYTLAPRLIQEKYRGYEEFLKRYCQGYKSKRDGKWYGRGGTNLEELREAIKDFIMYVGKNRNLPPLYKNTLWVDLGEFGHDETNTEMSTLRRLVGEAKVPYVVEYLKDRMEQNPDEKILVYIWHKEVARQLAAAFPGISRLVYGELSRKRRDQALEDFIQVPEVKLLIGQMASIGEAVDGIQRVCYNYVRVEPNWTPGNVDQQDARIQRTGQQNDWLYGVEILAEGTIDERVTGRCSSKQKVLDKLFTPIKELSMLEQFMALIERAVVALETIAGNAGSAITTTKSSSAAQEKPAASKSESAKGADKPTGNGSKGGKKEEKKTATVEEIRAAAGEAIAALGESEENRKVVQDIVKKHGSKTGKADGIPEAKRNACLAEIQALIEQANEGGEEEGEESGDEYDV